MSFNYVYKIAIGDILLRYWHVCINNRIKSKDKFLEFDSSFIAIIEEINVGEKKRGKK